MKKGYLILSGGGDVDISFKIDEKFFSHLMKGSKVLYIPVALDRTMLGFEACYDWFSALVSNHGTDKDIDFTMILEGDAFPNLDNYDAMYIGGGNTYKLLDYFHRKKLEEKIVKFIRKGGVIYGGSAGAMVLGKDIRTVEEENDKNYIHSAGLNLIEGKSIICHYVESLDDKIFEISKRINSKIIALPEDAGLMLDSNGKILETVGNVFVFDEENRKYI